MYNELLITHEEATDAALPLVAQLSGYQHILDKHGLNYTETSNHLQVGVVERTQGWILHISVVRWQMEDVLNKILPLLAETRAPFRIAKDIDAVRNILDGNIGKTQIGKVISIYPDSDQMAIDLAGPLVELTALFKGPEILTDKYLGGRLYTRYGAFNPVKVLTPDGRQENYIYSSNGELIKDNLAIPFTVPDVSWPFRDIRTSTSQENAPFNPRYKPIVLLKTDAKGDVIKALYLTKFFWIKWCVIKEGISNMWSDDAGRDMVDRLLWQQELHTKLSAKISLPKIIDLFYRNGNAYLVMEYIKGQTLNNYISDLNNESLSWSAIPIEKKGTILDLAIQLIAIIKTLHQCGIIHRDITPVNFMIDKKGQLVLIDIELAFSFADNKPYPAFEGGTNGFMSPEQVSMLSPTIKEDIYGLGACLLVLLTGMSPVTFTIEDREQLAKNISSFLNKQEIVGLIVKCLDPDPQNRPCLSDLETAFLNYREELKIDRKRYVKYTHSNSEDIKEILEKGIFGLSQPPTVMLKDIWYARAASHDDKADDRSNNEFEKSIGLYDGLCGIIYFLNRARLQGFQTDDCKTAYVKSWEYILHNHCTSLEERPPGLYGGSAGIAIALSTAIDSRLMEGSAQHKSLIYKCLSQHANDLNMARGSAGQIAALLVCLSSMEEARLEDLLHGHVDSLISTQQQDGGWFSPEKRGRPDLMRTSFGWGNTGILWSLLEYRRLFSISEVESSIEKGIQSLKEQIPQIRTLVKRHGLRALMNNDLAKDCITGILLVLIKAYEVLHDQQYKKWAEEILSIFPMCLIADNYTQYSGLSGLGEVYLEASRVLKSEQYRDKADWIANFFTHTFCKGENENIYWLGSNMRHPTASLMTGNSGILHFLLRYHTGNKLGYRLLS